MKTTLQLYNACPHTSNVGFESVKLYNNWQMGHIMWNSVSSNRVVSKRFDVMIFQ